MKKAYAIKKKLGPYYLLPMGAGGATFSQNEHVLPELWATQEGVLATMGRIATKYSSCFDLDDLEFVCFDLVPVRKRLL